MSSAPDPAQTEALLERYRPTIFYWAHRLRWMAEQLAALEQADIEQQCWETALQAAQSYEPERHGGFGTYLNRRLHWDMLLWWKRRARRIAQNEVPLAARTPRGQGEDESGYDPGPSHRRPVPRGPHDPLAGMLDLHAALRTLTPLQQALVVGEYWRDWTAAAVGRTLGLSPDHAVYQRRIALAALARALVPPQEPEEPEEPQEPQKPEHCKHGHLWTEESTSWNKRGFRVCRICTRAQQRARYAREREQG